MLKIEKKIENRIIIQSHREHLGCSVVGKDCKRKSWYMFRWAGDRIITPRQERLFSRGHMEELVVLKDLIDSGCKVKGVNLDQSIIDRFKTIFNIDLPKSKQYQKYFAHGFCSGSCDSIISNLPDLKKKEKALFECKTAATKYFLRMQMKGIKKAFYEYYVQINMYMKLFKLKYCLFVMVNKETDERYYELIKYDKSIAKEQFDIAEQIVLSETPPPRISDNPDYYKCGEKWCEYRLLCHFDKKPLKNCRTCANFGLRSSENSTKGKVVCEARKGKERTYKQQVKGCGKYKINKVFKTN